MKLTRRWAVLGVAALVVAVPVAWYLLSPLFITRRVNEPLPGGLPAPAVSFSGGDATAAMSTAMAETPREAGEAMPAVDMTTTAVLYQGEFYNIVHEGQGQAIFFMTVDGGRFLRLENFEVLNGPELHVGLVPVDPVPNAVGAEIEGYFDLGLLKGNVGGQNYDLPADLDLALYKSVVIWCRPFRVPFIAAPLGST